MKKPLVSNYEFVGRQAFHIIGGSVLLAAGVKLIFKAGCRKGSALAQDVFRVLEPDSYEDMLRKWEDFVNTH